MRGETGLALIIAWKAVKAVILLVAGIGLLVSLGSGLTPLIERIADVTHVAPDLLESRLTRRNVTLGGLGLIGVAAFNVMEAVVLYSRKPWGEWLVVLATSSLIPIEIWRIVEAPHAVRIATLLVNLLIVWYLARRLRRHRPVEKLTADG